MGMLVYVKTMLPKRQKIKKKLIKSRIAPTVCRPLPNKTPLLAVCKIQGQYKRDSSRWKSQTRPVARIFRGGGLKKNFGPFLQIFVRPPKGKKMNAEAD